MKELNSRSLRKQLWLFTLSLTDRTTVITARAILLASIVLLVEGMGACQGDGRDKNVALARNFSARVNGKVVSISRDQLVRMRDRQQDISAEQFLQLAAQSLADTIRAHVGAVLLRKRAARVSEQKLEHWLEKHPGHICSRRDYRRLQENDRLLGQAMAEYRENPAKKREVYDNHLSHMMSFFAWENICQQVDADEKRVELVTRLADRSYAEYVNGQKDIARLSIAEEELLSELAKNVEVSEEEIRDYITQNYSLRACTFWHIVGKTADSVMSLRGRIDAAKYPEMFAPINAGQGIALPETWNSPFGPLPHYAFPLIGLSEGEMSPVSKIEALETVPPSLERALRNLPDDVAQRWKEVIRISPLYHCVILHAKRPYVVTLEEKRKLRLEAKRHLTHWKSEKRLNEWFDRRLRTMSIVILDKRIERDVCSRLGIRSD